MLTELTKVLQAKRWWWSLCIYHIAIIKQVTY